MSMSAELVRYSSARQRTQRTRAGETILSRRCTRSQAWQTISDGTRSPNGYPWLRHQSGKIALIRPPMRSTTSPSDVGPIWLPTIIQLGSSMQLGSWVKCASTSRECALWCCWPCAARRVRMRADPQPYKVDLAPTGDNSLDATLRATSDLLALRTSAPVSPFGLIARARSDIDRLKTVLESYGYYQSKRHDPNQRHGLERPRARRDA